MKKTKIVITGGPSGGKTTLIETLLIDFKGHAAVVPEAASILYRGGFPRKSSPAGKIAAQTAIYHTQRSLESLVEVDNSSKFIICDRGSLDSIAYWPSNTENFFLNFATSLEAELSRYDWVLHLKTADSDFFDTTNPVRTESHLEAVQLDEKIMSAWDKHPQRIVIGHSDEFLEKISLAKKVLKAILKGSNLSEVRSLVSSENGY